MNTKAIREAVATFEKAREKYNAFQSSDDAFYKAKVAYQNAVTTGMVKELCDAADANTWRLIESAPRDGKKHKRSNTMSSEVKRYGPKEIYLQVHGDAAPDETTEVDYKSGDVTWCWDRIFDHDERYVHESALTERDRQWRKKVEGLYTDTPHEESCPAYGWTNLDMEDIVKRECDCHVGGMLKLLEDSE